MTSMYNSYAKAWNRIFVFATWTVTSFLCHHFGKTFLVEFTNSTLGQISVYSHNNANSNALLFGPILPAFLLTGGQLACCVMFVFLDNGPTPSTAGHNRTVKLCHALATLATNISMSFMASSSTFAIKMMEPVTSAIVQHLRVGSRFSPMSVVSLPFIVGGAIAFVGNLMATFDTVPGMMCAFVSNIVLAFRNMEIKNMTNKSNPSPLKSRYGCLGALIPFSATIMFLSVCLLLESTDVLPESSTQILLYACVSGLFHVGYSYVSTALVLTQISVVSHAVANIMKRLLVVLLLYMFGQRVATIWNFTGLLVCTIGLLVYAWDKTRPQEGTNIGGAPRISLGKRPLFIVTSVISLFLLLTSTKSLGVSRSTLNLPEAGFTPSKYISSHEFKTFEGNGLKTPNITQLLPNLDELPDEQLQELFDFLKLPSQKNVTNVNFLSLRLPTSNGVIKEARRLHFSILGKELERFKYAFLFDAAAFENKGDSAITSGEIYFLARMNIELKYYCSAKRCTQSKLMKAKELAQNYSPEELVILFHGGGNMIGYPMFDILRFDVIELFSSFKILAFPHGIWVKSWSDPHVNRTAKNYCCHPNLTIVLRDSVSYNIAKKLFNGTTRIIMAPDMAFQIGHIPRFMSPVFDIIWLKREDYESTGYKLPKHVPHDIRVHVVDFYRWKTQPALTQLEKAFYLATNGFFSLQRGRVVITDRLHGHIFSVLMDIPHVILDNEWGKVSSYHKTWTRSLSNTVVTDDPNKALDLAIELLRKYNDTLAPVVPFLHVREDFSKAISGVPETQYP